MINNSDQEWQEAQDQRKSSGMEDSTTMTIDFLRARLLSERSVSRSARQRAEELSKRVAELEEQLKIVSMQRKMAEKATADVLAILEDNGISEISEELDSNSDQEIPCESKAGHISMGDDLCSVNSKARKSEMEDLSGSDRDSSSVLGGSLSWKGRCDSSRLLDKYKDYSMRRQRSMTSVGSSSPKHCRGRSCRQIKRRETRLVDDEKTEPSEDHSEENVAFVSSEVSPNCLIDASKTLREVSDIKEEKVLSDGTLCNMSQNQGSKTAKDLDFAEYRRENDMERALENQAQLIDRYEAMEKAQRDWEEKFRENSNSTPDSFEHGNHSDITEERDEIKDQAANSSDNANKEEETEINDVHKQKTETEDVCISDNFSGAKRNGLLHASSLDMGDSKTLSHAQPKNASQSLFVDVGNSHDNIEDSSNGRRKDDAESQSAADFSFPIDKTNEIERSLENGYHPSPHSSEHKDFPGNLSFQAQIFDSKSNFSKMDASDGPKDEFYALIPHDPGLSGVLEALNRAKLSLQKKINGTPVVVSDRFGKGNETSIFDPKNGARVDIPTGYAGLFRLPTDYSVEGFTRTDFHMLNSQLKSAHAYPNEQTTASSNDRFASGPYADSRSRSSSNNLFYQDDRDMPRRLLEISWRDSPPRPHLDRYTGNLAQPFSTYNYQPLSNLSRVPQNEVFSRNFLGREAESPLANGFSHLDDHNQPGTYR